VRKYPERRHSRVRLKKKSWIQSEVDERMGELGCMTCSALSRDHARDSINAIFTPLPKEGRRSSATAA
jgi:hypothetical protein